MLDLSLADWLLVAAYLSVVTVTILNILLVICHHVTPPSLCIDNMTVMMNEGRNRAMERGAMAGAVRGGITRGAHTGAASTPPSFGSSSGGSSTGNSIPSERVMRAWKEMLVFLQVRGDSILALFAVRLTVCCDN